MRKKKQVNYLDMIPTRADLAWSADENGIVTLEIENKGVMNTIAQKLFRKPRVSYVHLDETGSFLWPLIDGKRTVYELAGPVKERFGEAAEPLYPRIAKYFQVLASYQFVALQEKSKDDPAV